MKLKSKDGNKNEFFLSRFDSFTVVLGIGVTASLISALFVFLMFSPGKYTDIQRQISELNERTTRLMARETLLTEKIHKLEARPKRRGIF